VIAALDVMCLSRYVTRSMIACFEVFCLGETCGY